VATNFLNAAGTNGFIAAPFSIVASTQLSSLGSGSAVLVSTVFSQTDYSNAPWGSMYFEAAGAFTPTAGGYLAIWFVLSYDGGTGFETHNIATASTTVMAMGRSPDVIIPTYEGGAAWASGNRRWNQGRYFKTPWESHKVLIQNLSGVALSANNHIIKAMGMAQQY
jgi:hypothetical protein